MKPWSILLFLLLLSAHAQAFPVMGAVSVASPSPPITNILRTAAVQPSSPNTVDTVPAYSKRVDRWPMVLGSGNFSKLIFSFNNWAMTSTGDYNVADTLVIDAAYLEIGGTSVQITFNSSGTVTLASGATDIQSDAILPAAFSLANFAQGTTIWIRTIMHTGSGTHAMVDRFGVQAANYTGSVDGWYDPAVTTVTNISGTGPITVTGTALYQRSIGYAPIVLGTFTSGDPATWGIIGDSIPSGQGGTSGQQNATGIGGIYGYSFFERALHDAAGTSSTAIAGLTGSSPGSSYAGIQGTNSKSWGFYQYAKYWFDDMGTNNFGGNGNSMTAAQVLALAQTTWGTLKSNALAGTKVVRLGLLDRTTSTDSFATEANQTVAGTGWDAGGNVETFAWGHEMIATDLRTFINNGNYP